MLALVPATAAAAPLAVTSLVIPSSRAALAPDEPFTLRGRIANRAARPRTVTLTFALRTRRARRAPAYRLGPGHVLTVSAGAVRRFRARVQLPGGFPLRAGRRLHVSLCVRRTRGSRSRCRITRRTIAFAARSGGGSGTGSGPGGSQAPPTSPPATPGEPATPPGTGTGTPGDETPPTHTPGSRSGGDRLFPQIGNGGYDVRHYDLQLEYEPLTRLLGGTAAIEAEATQNLSEYSLDLVTMDVSAVSVDGAEAQFRQEDGELIVTPPAPIDDGTVFTTTVSYGGTATPYQDPDGSYEGFLPTEDGAYVVNEPVGAMSWFPSNNVPTDKALYDIHLTVPAASTVFGNGQLESTTADGTLVTWHWREDSPMATYLVTATNGVFERTTATSGGIPFEFGVDPKIPGGPLVALPPLERSPEVVDFLVATLGTPYPFTSSGGVADVPPESLAAAPYALESQTRPMYPLVPGEDTVAHEIAHQWFGDSVSPAQWADIWLNEGPAEFYSWLWDERDNGGDTTTAERFDAFYEDADFDWSVPPANPEADELFNTDAMYNRGGMVMEALRQIVGEQRFLELNREWLETHRHGHASTADFIALFREGGGVSATQLDVFFSEWLYGTTRPGITPENFATYVP